MFFLCSIYVLLLSAKCVRVNAGVVGIKVPRNIGPLCMVMRYREPSLYSTRNTELHTYSVQVNGGRTYMSEGLAFLSHRYLVISLPDNIFLYTAMYVGPIRPSVTGPLRI